MKRRLQGNVKFFPHSFFPDRNPARGSLPPAPFLPFCFETRPRANAAPTAALTDYSDIFIRSRAKKISIPEGLTPQ